MSGCPVGTSGNTIIGIECWKCKKDCYNVYNHEHWCYFLHKNCAYCGQENAIGFKWGPPPRYIKKKKKKKKLVLKIK